MILKIWGPAAPPPPSPTPCMPMPLLTQKSPVIFSLCHQLLLANSKSEILACQDNKTLIDILTYDITCGHTIYIMS